MATAEKIAQVEQLTKDIKSNEAIYIVKYQGLKAGADNTMRRDFVKNGVTYKVAKNTLIKIALKNGGIEGLDSYLTKDTAIAMGNDLIGLVKIMDDYNKKHKDVKVPEGKAVYYQGTVYSGAELAKIATIPSRDQLYGMVASCIIGPIRNLAFGIKAIAEKKEETEK